MADDFVTKDSGVREEFDSGMVRDTQEGKPRFDLMFPKGIPYADQLITRFAALMERGMAKYGERNWEKANSQVELDRAKASAMRHLMQWYLGEKDEDHAAAVLFNLMAAETIALKMAGGEVKPIEGLGFFETKTRSVDQLPRINTCSAICGALYECELSAGHTGSAHLHGRTLLEEDGHTW